MTFISKEVENLSSNYLDNPFGSKKDKRIDNWIEILKSLPLLDEVQIDLRNEVSIDFTCKDTKDLEEILLQLLPWRKGPFRLNEINIDSEFFLKNKDIKINDKSLKLYNKIILNKLKVDGNITSDERIIDIIIKNYF